MDGQANTTVIHESIHEAELEDRQPNALRHRQRNSSQRDLIVFTFPAPGPSIARARPYLLWFWRGPGSECVYMFSMILDPFQDCCETSKI